MTILFRPFRKCSKESGPLRPPTMRVSSSLVLSLAVAANAQWTKVPVPTTASLRGLSAVSADVIWASGTGGTGIKNVRGGKTWAGMVVAGAEKLDVRGIRAFHDK